MRKVAFLIIGAAVLAVPAAAKEPLAPKTVFGVSWNNRQASFAELDALTLQPVSKAVPLGKGGWYLGRSPRGGLVAAIAVGPSGDAVRFVNLSTMTLQKRVQLPCAISRTALWEEPNSLVVTCGGSASSVLLIDTVRQRLVSRKPVRGELGDVQAAGGLLVGVLAPLGNIGAARLVVVDWSGFTRIAKLPGVQAGTKVLDQNTYHARVERPALAIEPGGRRAAVVPAQGPVTVVDLSSLAATRYAVRTPAARRKDIEGNERTAIWTWNNTIAVGGWDWTADGQPDHAVPSGVTLIDTTTWTSRVIDRAAAAVSYTGVGGTLLAWGSTWDSVAQKSIGSGLTGYGFDGLPRFHLFGTDPVGIAAVAGTYAYVIRAGSSTHYEIVDTTTGAVIRAVDTVPTQLYPTRPNY